MKVVAWESYLNQQTVFKGVAWYFSVFQRPNANNQKKENVGYTLKFSK